MSPSLTEEQVRQIIRDELSNFLGSDKYLFQKHLQLFDGRNIQTGLTTGTKIGTATTQKISLWNATPIIQPASGNQAALSLDTDVTGADTVDKAAINTNFTNIQTLVNRLRTDLVSVGIIKGAA